MSSLQSLTPQQVLLLGQRLVALDALESFDKKEMISIGMLIRLAKSPVTKTELTQAKKVAGEPVEVSLEEKIKIETHTNEIVHKVETVLDQVEDEETRLTKLKAMKHKRPDLETLAKSAYAGAFVGCPMSDLESLIALGRNRYSVLQTKILSGTATASDFTTEMSDSVLKKLASHLKIKQGKARGDTIKNLIERTPGGRGSRQTTPASSVATSISVSSSSSVVAIDERPEMPASIMDDTDEE